MILCDEVYLVQFGSHPVAVVGKLNIIKRKLYAQKGKQYTKQYNSRVIRK
jgi:hypothetical protein